MSHESSESIEASKVESVRSFDQLYVGGRFVEPAGAERADVVSPSTEEVVAQVPVANTADMDAAVAAARAAFDSGPWPRMHPSERADALRRIGKELESRLPS